MPTTFLFSANGPGLQGFGGPISAVAAAVKPGRIAARSKLVSDAQDCQRQRPALERRFGFRKDGEGQVFDPKKRLGVDAAMEHAFVQNHLSAWAVAPPAAEVGQFDLSVYDMIRSTVIGIVIIIDHCCPCCRRCCYHYYRLSAIGSYHDGYPLL